VVDRKYNGLTIGRSSSQLFILTLEYCEYE
jgi:hypothetical protein